MPTYSLSAPPTEEIVAAPAPTAPPPAQPTTTYSLSAPPPAQPLSTAPAQPAQLPPAEYVEQGSPPQRVDGQGPLDPFLGPVGPAIQNVADAVFQPGGLLSPSRREYRPGDAVPGSVPMGAGWGEDRYAAAGQAASEGRYKDALGAAIQGNWGDVSPVRATNLQAQTEAELRASSPEVAADVLPAQQPDPLLDAVVQTYRDAPFLNAFTTHMQQNPDIYARIATEGYTTPEGLVWQGPRAAYEYFQSGQSGLQRLGTDILQDPVGTATDIASTALSAGGSLVGKGALRTGLNVASRALDVPGTMGLSEAVPGVLKGAGAIGRKTGLLSPSKAAEAERAGAAVTETGAAVLSDARTTGAVGQPTSMLSTPARGITRVTTPSADLAYDVDPTYGVRVYDDAANPTTWRTPTEADFGTVMGAMREMPQADRARVTQPWFDYGMRHQDAAGDDLIDPLAPDLPGGITTGRNTAAHRRWVEDRADAIRRFDDPDGNRPVLYHLMDDWRRTFYERGVHPRTKRDLAEHRLQAIKNVLAEVPDHDNAWAKARIADMEAQLKAPPGSIGHGTRRMKNGSVLPFQRVDTERLNLLAKTDPKAFWKGRLRKGALKATALTDTRVTQADIKRGLITPYKPRGTAPAHTVHAYENFLALAEARLSNPALKRADVGAIRDRMQRAVGTAPGAQSRAALDGMKDALDRSGILPGAATMADADVEMALTGWLKATPSFSIATPPGGASLTPPVLGVYDPGSASEGLRMLLDEPTEAMLSDPYEVNGVLKKPWEELLGESQRMAAAREAARAQAAGRTLSAPEAKALTTTVEQTKKLHREYRDLTAQQLADMSDEEMDRLTAATVGEQVARSMGYDPAKKGKLLAFYDGFNSMLRSLILYSPARMLQYPLMQLVGNFVTLGVASKGAIRYYNPLDLRTVKRFTDDPELNKAAPAIVLRDEVGLGRSANLGRVSRDQMGPYTFFSDPGKPKALQVAGKVLAPQIIKNYADAGDTLHRHALWRSVFEPGYRQLKRQLPVWADEVFSEARVRTGLPLPLTRDQIATAIRDLEDASPRHGFSAVQLREALVEAAGGASAPNRSEVFNAADRVHRLYREKVTELDKAAQAEVNRVAFNPLETNLDTVLQRLFLFSWWNTRAANLYAQEIARSPIMLGMFSRAVATGQQNMMEGQSEGTQNYIEFMRTPAGFAMQFNPFTLSSSFLSMAGLEGPDGKKDYTKLGELLTTGVVGNNLFLAPPVKAALGWLGALGADYYQQDLTGMRRIERLLNNVAEYVNREVYTFHETNGGNPDLVPQIDLNDFQDFFHAHLSGQLPFTQEVPGYDANATEQGQYAFFVQQRLLQQNPELATPDAEDNVYAFEQAMREVLANPDSPIAQQAMEDYTASLFGGPMSDKGGLLAIVGAAMRENLPILMQSQPSSRVDYWGRRNRDAMREDVAAVGMLPDPEKTAVDKAMGFLPYETPEMRAYKLAENSYYGNDDPQLQEVRRIEDAIKDGTWDQPLTMFDGAVTFTPDQIAVMSAKDRRAVAGAWLQETGFAEASDAAWDEANAMLAENPDLANGMGWWRYAQQYPGGPLAALDATAQVNENVARWVNDPDNVKLRRENPDDFLNKGVRYLGPLVAGLKSDRFDFAPIPGNEGVVGGLDGTVGAWLTEQQAGDGEVGEWEAVVAEGLDAYNETEAALLQYDPSGVTLNEYRANIIAGSSRPIPYGAYQAGVRGYVPDDSRFGQYLEWAISEPQGADTSPSRWNQESYKSYQRERTLEIANEVASGVYVAQEPVVEGEEAAQTPGVSDVGRPATYAYVSLAPRQALYDADGRFLGVPQQGATLAVVSEFTDASGKKWAVLQDNAGATYTAPTSGLLKAA